MFARRILTLAFGLYIFCAPYVALAANQTLDLLSSGAPLSSTDYFFLCKTTPCNTGDLATIDDISAYQHRVDVHCTNTAGDIALIRSAIATLRAVHIIGEPTTARCKEDTGDTVLTLGNNGQLIVGDGSTTSVITVNTVMTTALFNCTTGTSFTARGPRIKDLGVEFVQVNTASRASLTDFTPAFRFRDCAGSRIQGVRCSTGMVCFDMRDQSGQSVLEDIETSCLSVCIWTNGAADTIKIRNAHVWPYGHFLVETGTGCGAQSGATLLCSIFNAQNPNCIVRTTSGTEGPIGLLDEQGSAGGEDLKVSDSLFLIGRSACAGTVGNVQVSITNTAFDTYEGYRADRGNTRITTSYFGQLAGTMRGLLATGTAKISCGECTFVKDSTDAAGAGAWMNSGVMIITASTFDLNGGGYAVYGESAGRLTFTGNTIVNGGASGSHPAICVGCVTSGTVGIVANNQPDAAAASAATFISVGGDLQHRIDFNGLDTNWDNSCPGTQTTMRSGGNGGTSGATHCNALF